MELKKNINLLKISYILQIILLIIIIILNAVYKNKIDWMNKISTISFYFLFFCLIIISIFIFIFLIIIFFKTNYHAIFILLKLSTSLFVVRIIISIGLFTIYIVLNKNFKKFFEFCPFNYNISDLIKIFPILGNANYIMNNKEIKNKCLMRRCIEFNKKGEEYSYICNFNPNNKEINCGKNYFDNYEGNIPGVIISYLNLCNIYIEMYDCLSINRPKEYSIDSDYNCPRIKNRSLTLDIILIIYNLVIPISIYILQFIFYKRILKIIVAQEIQRHNDTIINKTIDSSKKLDSNKSNKTNKSFEKEKTEVIVIDKNNDVERNITQILYKNKKTNKNKSIKMYKRELFPKTKKKKNFEKENKINNENIINKSFTKISADFNVRDNKSNLNNNSIRLLTEINKNKSDNTEEQKEDKVKIKFIVIKK